MEFIRSLLYIVGKDIRVEFRTRETLGGMFTFALLVVVIFGFAFSPTRNELSEVFPGLLWVTFFFAGLLGLNRSFTVEKTNSALEGLILAPMDRSVIYFAKVLGNLFFLTLVEVVALPLFFIFFNQTFEGSPGLLALAVLLSTFGFVAVGTFLAALVANTKTSELLLPIVLFPVVVPVVIAAVRVTTGILGATGDVEYMGWFKVLATYDLVFLVVPFLLFEYLVEV